MPNDLTAKRNLFNRRADAPTSQRQKLVSSGFTASIWTISGVVLAACSSTIEDIEEFLGLDDGGDGGGNALHVQRSPVQGARIYFDMDNNGVIDTDDITAQDEAFPQGFVTDAAGRAHNIPAIFHGLPFKAVLDGAIDADTRAELSGELRSIPNADDDHLLASPITEYIAEQADTAAEVVAEWLGLDTTTPLPPEQERMRDSELRAILTSANYQGGDARIETLAVYLAHTPLPIQTEITRILIGDTADPDNTLIVVSEDMVSSDAVTIGTHDSYVATIQAVSHAGGVGYRFVDANRAPTTISDFSINAQGVISFIGANPTTATLHIEVSNGTPSETQIVRVEVTVAPAPTVDELPAGDETATIMENVEGAAGDGTALITGITTSATNPSWEISEANPAGQSAIASKFGIVSGSGDTFNLVLKAGEILNYDAIPGGVLNLHVWAEVGVDKVRSNALALRIQVEEDPDEVAFSGSFTGIVAEDGNLVAQGTFSVENQPENEAVDVSSQGAFGELVLGDNGAWTYTLTNTNADVDELLTGQTLIDTATISVGGASQNIVIRIDGTNENVRFVDGDGNRITSDVAENGIEIGADATGGVNLGDVVPEIRGLLPSNDDSNVVLADDMGGLFSLDSATGVLTFTGTAADIAGLNGSANLELVLTAPASIGDAEVRLNLRVNVINEVDDGRAEYEVTGDVDVGQTLTVSRVQGSDDPDGIVGAVSFQWFRGDENSPTLLGTGDTYRVTQTDIDSSDSIGVFVRYTDGSGVTYTHTDGDPATTIAAFASPVSFTGPAIADRTINLDEDTTSSTVHFAVRAESEDDAGAPVGIDNYMLLDANNMPTTTYRGFTIDTTSGDITLTGSLDYEMDDVITLRVRATDMNSPAETATLTLTVNVGDVNDNAPAFTQATYTADIDETLGNGAEVARVSARDDDGTTANNTVGYSITAGNTGNVFDIDDNGVITVLDANELDFETTPSYTLTITATDNGSPAMMDTATVTITVNDVNDITPTYMVTAGENSASVRGTEAGGNSADVGTGYRITITDADTTNTFRGNFDVSDRRFDFVETSAGSGVWELTLLANEAVALSEASLTITYQVHDGANTAAGGRGSVTVAVVDSTVTYTATQNAPLEIPEADSIDTTTLGTGGVLAQVTAESSENQTVTYTLTSAVDQNGADVSSLFTVDGDDGEVRFTDSTVNLDYEAVSEYSLVITASARQSATTMDTDDVPTTVIIRVINEQEGDGTYIIEGNVAAGAELMAVVTDPDGTRSVTYEWYSLDSSGGDRQVIAATESIRLPGAADFDDTRTYHVTITHTDNLGHTPGPMTLDASAVVFEFQDTTGNAFPSSIAENTDSLPVVVASLDGDTRTATYTFVGGDTITTSGVFTISQSGSTAGAITVNAPSDINFETAQEFNDGSRGYTLNVRATFAEDTANNLPEVTGDVVVTIIVTDVNEHAPVFVTNADDNTLSTGTDEIAEDAANGTRVGLFRATDADGSNNDVTYSLDDGGLGVFGIREVTGTNNWEIYVLNNANLDYDPTTTKPTPTRSYTIEITATDSDPDNAMSSAPESFTINITDVNDNDPVLSATPVWEGTLDFGVPENTVSGVHLFTVSATDADTATTPPPTLTYEIVSIDGVALASITNPIFGIDASDGRVELAGQLDRETKASHEIVIRAVDEGGRASNEETFTVTVGDVNDNKPVIPDQVFISIYASGVPESAGSGALFANDGVNPGVLLVNDDDLNQSFTYRIVSIDGVAFGDITNPLFVIQSTSGRFGSIGKLDYETAQSHSVVFEVTDQGGMVSEHKEVVINVLNVDEGDASYAITGTTANNGMLSVALDTNNPDPDGLVAGSESYRWFILNSDDTIPGDGEANGNIDDAGSDDGDDSTLKLPADVGSNVYGVVVTYRDNAGETEEVTVIASAVQFTQNTYTVSFNEATTKPVQTVGLVQVRASLNTNQGAKVDEYKFLKGGAGGMASSDDQGFTISASGIINFKDSVFDFDNITDKVYTLTVRASYKSGETGIATVEITITDANDIVPDLSQSGTATPIMENAAGATTGITFTVADADTVNTITYDVAATTSNTNNDAIAAMFEVDKTTGMLKLDGVALDREHDALITSGQISLTITANDGVRDSNSETVTITVTDENDSAPTATTSGTAMLTEADAVSTNTATGFSITLADDDTDAVNEHAITVTGDLATRFGFVKDGTTANQWNLVLLANQIVDRDAGGDGETLTIAYTISDDTNTPITDSVTVNIADANDKPTEIGTTKVLWDNIATSGAIPENSYTAGTEIGKAIVNDVDAGANLEYRLTKGDSIFSISNTGIITFTANTDVDADTAPTSYTLAYEVRDRDGAWESSGDITLTITNTNDETPTFANPVVTWEAGFEFGVIPESTDGSATRVLVGRVAINDADGATFVGDRTFAINGAGTKFVIERNADTTANGGTLGEGLIYLTGALDREANTNPDPEFAAVTITVNDGVNPAVTSAAFDIEISDVNDEPTVIGATKVLWESPTVSGTIPEGSYTAGTEIARAIVRDADVSSNLEYRLTNGGSTFSIGSTDGIITFTADTDLDADTAPTSYTLAYEVRDRDGAWETSGDITLTVTDIDDEKPEFGAFTWQTGTGSGVAGEEHIRTINEDQGASPILVMSVSDPDTTTATLIAGIYGGSPRNSAGDPIFSFGILNNQAILSVLSSRLDYETAPNTYTLTLVVNDGTRTDTETVTINVGDINDNAPDIVVADSTPSVTARTASADTDIITGITVTDADVGKTYAQGDFELTGDADNRFNFVWDATAQTGSVVLKSGETIAAGTISLSLTVTDANPVGHAGTDTQALTITVTELVNGGNAGTAMQYDPSAADASGTLTYIDAAQVKANPVAGDYTATDGQYGTATVDASGTWTYNVDNTHAMVKGLASGATLTDTFTIGVPLAAGGTGDVDVTVTINPVTTVHEANLDRSSVTEAASRVEVIQGGDGDDTIIAGDGGSFIFGGYGDDTITLGDGVDVLVYRFSSIDGSWRADDGGDTIIDFERGKDKIIFVDVDTNTDSVGSYANFINYDVSSSESLSVKPKTTTDLTTITGVEITFGQATDDNGPDNDVLTGSSTLIVRINWLESDRVSSQDATHNRPLLGFGDTDADYYNADSTKDTGHWDFGGSKELIGSGSFELLPNYFNDYTDSTSTGHLDVITLADLAIDVL